MSTTDISGEQRFTTPETAAEDISAHVKSRLDETHLAILGEADGWDWAITTISLDQITVDSDLTPPRNAAQLERNRAIARTKLNMCEAPPLIVITDDYILLEGHPRVEYLEEIGESHAVVYHGTPQ